MGAFEAGARMARTLRLCSPAHNTQPHGPKDPLSRVRQCVCVEEGLVNVQVQVGRVAPVWMRPLRTLGLDTVYGCTRRLSTFVNDKFTFPSLSVGHKSGWRIDKVSERQFSLYSRFVGVG